MVIIDFAEDHLTGLTPINCDIPSSGDWTLTFSCAITGSQTFNGNVILDEHFQSSDGLIVILPIHAGDFDLDFATKKLLIKTDNYVLIKNGATIT